ncbi:MAG: hypothetical protein WC477_05995 [Patescibacteria group bacterium]
MRDTASIAWTGRFEVYINGEYKETIKNMIMNAALDELVKPLYGGTPNLEIKYLAVGSNTAAVTVNDAALGTETFRCADSSLSATATGQVTSEFLILSTEAVGTIEEIGIFGGTSATLTADVGIMISHIAWHHVKTNTEEITFRRVDTLARA